MLDGRLYLKGYGDPTTRESDYAVLARQVKAAGITRVTGQLVVDPSYFDAVRYNPGWSKAYAEDYYAGEISALTVAPNADHDSGTVILKFRPGRAGRPGQDHHHPGGRGDVRQDRQPDHDLGPRDLDVVLGPAQPRQQHDHRLAAGCRSAGRPGRWQITVHRPELYAAAVFRAELAKVGVKVDGATLVGSPRRPAAGPGWPGTVDAPWPS